MVKRSRGQSSEAPRRRSWRVIPPPDSSFHCHTRSIKASRPISCRVVLPSAASVRSTTICVAMPAWSVPGCQSVSNPCILFHRIRVSCNVMVNAWPIWSVPVTLGGGIMIVKGFLSLAGCAEKAFLLSHNSYSRFSVCAGSKVLFSIFIQPHHVKKAAGISPPPLQSN